MAIKKHDYIELDYTGTIKDDGTVFDTTDATVAQKNHLHESHTGYKPVIVCIGKHQLIRGLDEQIIGKDIGTYTFEVKDVDAFGKKNAKLLKLIPLKVFQKENVRPFPGLDVNVDGQFGVVKSVSGGRVVVDFNHPLASKDVIYTIKIHRILTDEKEKVEGLLTMLKFPFVSVSVVGDKATVTTPVDIPEPLTTGLLADVTETTGIKTMDFTTAKKEGNDVHPHPHEHTHDHPHDHTHAGHDHHEGHKHK